MKPAIVRAIAGAVLAIATTTASAQGTGTGTADNLGKAVPPDVLEAIKKASAVTKIFPVNPGEKFSGQVLGCVDNQLSQISAAAMEMNASNLLSSLS